MIGACKRLVSIETPFSFDYKSFLNVIICENPTRECYFGECETCPGTEYLRTLLINIFDTEGVENVQYNQWVSSQPIGHL